MTVTIARTIGEARAMRAQWETVGVSDLDAEMDYFLTITEMADNVVRPHIVHISRPGMPDLMAVSRIEHVTYPFKAGYSQLASVTLPTVLVAFGGIVGARSPADERLLLDQLMQPLRDGDAELLVLREIDVASTLHQSARSMCSWPRRAHSTEISGRWIARLPGSLDDFLNGMSSKRRRRIRSQHRKLEADYGGRLTFRRFDRTSELDELMEGMEAVASTTYQRKLGAGFMNTPIDRALIRLALERGTFRAWLLYIDGRPVAFWNGTVIGRNFVIGTPGFDPAFSQDAVGRYAMLRMMEELCADPAMDVIDFGHGDADYKSVFGECLCDTRAIMLAAPRPWPMAVTQALSAFSFANVRGKRFLKEAEWGKRLRKKWRGQEPMVEKAAEAT